MKNNNIENNNSCGCSPTCGNCLHNSTGCHCNIFQKWIIMPEDPAEHCEYYFPRVKSTFYKHYYKHKPTSKKGWTHDPFIFMEMLTDLWGYMQDLRKGILLDNNGGYFTRWPFGNKIIPN